MSCQLCRLAARDGDVHLTAVLCGSMGPLQRSCWSATVAAGTGGADEPAAAVRVSARCSASAAAAVEVPDFFRTVGPKWIGVNRSGWNRVE